MSHRTAAIALACGLALATAGAARAETVPGTTAAPAAPAAPTMTMPDMPKMDMPKMMSDSGMGGLTLREVAAIGTGVVVGAALWHVVIGHGFMLAGAALGGWAGDWFYGTHLAPAAPMMPMRTGT